LEGADFIGLQIEREGGRGAAAGFDAAFTERVFLLLKGFSFSSPPAHESPVGVGWWGFN
jgi:hypothetical protein